MSELFILLTKFSLLYKITRQKVIIFRINFRDRSTDRDQREDESRPLANQSREERSRPSAGKKRFIVSLIGGRGTGFSRKLPIVRGAMSEEETERAEAV